MGFIRAAPEEGVVDIRQIGSVSYPYYGTPTAVQTSKQLFAVLSVIALAMTGVVAWRVTGRPGAVIMGPAILATSELFFQHSWQYLNVDIVGTCFRRADGSELPLGDRPALRRAVGSRASSLGRPGGGEQIHAGSRVPAGADGYLDVSGG